MHKIHSRLTDDELNELTKGFNKKLEEYPEYKILRKHIKSAVDDYNVVLFDMDECFYEVYLFDTKDCILDTWCGCGNTMIESVKLTIENHERVYYSQRNEFNRWDGDLTKL